ncbi:MAG: hypothetical protein U9N83_16115 [Thermodesulfobacteriota bacterium]|nr:hypothetical protein [Thermodesulfobacteriota bacterium]
MDQNPNPIRNNGEKNIFCPYYKDCLNHTAKLHWQNWDCSECPHKLTQQPIKTDQMASGFYPYCELPLRIHINLLEKIGLMK